MIGNSNTLERDEKGIKDVDTMQRNYETALHLSTTTHLKGKVALPKLYSVNVSQTIVWIRAKEEADRCKRTCITVLKQANAGCHLFRISTCFIAQNEGHIGSWLRQTEQ